MTLEKIKAEAINQFSKKGFHGTSIRDITKEVGITPPGLYAHYKSKEELFIDILQDCVQGVFNDVQDIIKRESFHDIAKILHGIYCYYLNEFTTLNPRMLLILHNSMFPDETLRDITTDIIIKAHKDIDVTITHILEGGLRDKILKNDSSEKYYRRFFCLITAHMYEILTFRIVISNERKNSEWEEFWNSIKY